MSSPRFRQTPAADIDVSLLPTYVYGAGSMMWWGTMGLMLIEGTVFALAIVMYFYLRSHSLTWPVNRAPELLWGGINTAILLVSLVPNWLTKRAAEREDLPAVRRWLAVCLLCAALFLTARVFEFGALHTRWDSNAYGSIVWMLLALHTTHLVTDTIDTAVLLVLMITGPLEGKRFVDVSENAMYWYFVVGSWLPIYAVIYWGASL